MQITLSIASDSTSKQSQRMAIRFNGAAQHPLLPFENAHHHSCRAKPSRRQKLCNLDKLGQLEATTEPLALSSWLYFPLSGWLDKFLYARRVICSIACLCAQHGRLRK